MGYESWRSHAPFLDVDLFAVHTLVNVCKIHVYSGVVTDGQSMGVGLGAGTDMGNVLQAANFIMSLIRQLSPGDYGYLDPLMSVSFCFVLFTLPLVRLADQWFCCFQACWLSVAKFYLQLLSAVNLGGLGVTSCSSLSAYGIEGELEVIVAAMRALSAYVPLAGELPIFELFRCLLQAKLTGRFP